MKVMISQPMNGRNQEDIKKLRESIIEKKYHIYNKDLKIILEHILSDYKRALKENEELKADNYELNNRITDLLENIPIQKIKDKIEEEKLPLTIVGGRKNKKTLEYGIKLGRRQALQELIEEREEK